MTKTEFSLEEAIGEAYELLLADWCSARWQALVALIRARSPEQVARLERAKGLA